MPDKVIVALDVDSREAALDLVAHLGDSATFYKVGLQLLTGSGNEVVKDLVGLGKKVFLDLKLHEIPNSVAGAVRAAGQLGVQCVTVHASAGSQVLRSAVVAASDFPDLRILALTVITSLTDSELPELGLEPDVQKQVRRLAVLAVECGCHGVVASVQEAADLKALLPADAWIVTPGIQLPDSSRTDQMRVATPQQAVQAGATHMIVGRAVTAALEPRVALEEVRQEF
jgi:orotidine-5'-phosphate decarboxylase